MLQGKNAMRPSFDPYDTLMDLIDKHNSLAKTTQQMAKNIEQIVLAHNALQKDFKEIKREIRVIKEKLNETT